MKPEKLSSVFDGIGNVVGYYPDVRHITGSINSAIYLCQVYYWSRESGEDGWVSRTQREIEESTGLSRREQETAKSLLTEQGLIEEQCRGKSNKTHLKFNREVAIAAWNRHLETGFSVADSRKQKRSKSTKSNLKNRGMAETDKAALHVSDKAEGDRSNPCSVELAQNRQSSFHKNDNGGNRQTALSETDTLLCTSQTNPLYIKEFKDLSLRGKGQILEGVGFDEKASQNELASNSQEGDRYSPEVSKTQEVASSAKSDALGSGPRYSAAAKPQKFEKPIHGGQKVNDHYNGTLPWRMCDRQTFKRFCSFVGKQMPASEMPQERKGLAAICNNEKNDIDLQKNFFDWDEFVEFEEVRIQREEQRQQSIAASAAPSTFSDDEYYRTLIPKPDWDRPSLLTLLPRASNA